MEVMEMSEVGAQVVKALDGRTRRWLALRAAIPESDLSKKISGRMKFTDQEIKAINALLKSKIKK